MTDPFSDSDEGEGEGGKKRRHLKLPDAWRAFAVLMAGTFMTLLDISIVNVALPSITERLGASSAQLQWIVAGYSLAVGLMLVPSGRLGDIYGRRTLFAIGVAGFTVSSLLCGLAPTAMMLTIARFVQGTFAALLTPQVVGLIQQMFRGNARARAFGYNGAAIGVSTALGPPLGGFLISFLSPELGWRSIFLINVPIGVIVLYLLFRIVPKDRRADSSQRIKLDIVGLILMSSMTVMIMLPLVLATESRSGEGVPWWMLPVAGALLVAFFLWEYFRDRAGYAVLLPRYLMRTPSYMLGALIGTVFFVGNSGFFVSMTLYLQSGVGYPAWIAGLMQMPYAIGNVIGATSSGRLLPRLGRKLVIAGCLLTITGMSLIKILTLSAPEGNLAWVLPFLFFVAGMGTGSMISPNTALSLQDVPVEHSSTAGAMLQSTQRVGITVSITLLTMAFFGSLEPGLRGMPATTTAQVVDYSQAFGHALTYTLVGVSAALVLSLVDMFRRSRAPQ